MTQWNHYLYTANIKQRAGGNDAFDMTLPEHLTAVLQQKHHSHLNLDHGKQDYTK